MDLITPVTRANLTGLLMLEEGLSLKLYKDKYKKWTIGYGRNMQDRGISKEEARFMLENDIDIVLSELQQNLPFFDALSDCSKAVLTDMGFNMGVPKLLGLGDYQGLGFDNFLNYLRKRNYLDASREMLKSKWAEKDVPSRAKRLAKFMETQDFSYVEPAKPVKPLMGE